jgi:hypothetical protein
MLQNIRNIGRLKWRIDVAFIKLSVEAQEEKSEQNCELHLCFDSFVNKIWTTFTFPSSKKTGYHFTYKY